MENRMTVAELISHLEQFDKNCLIRINVGGNEELNPIIDIDTTKEDENGLYPVIIG